jgi:hypothetical protein
VSGALPSGKDSEFLDDPGWRGALPGLIPIWGAQHAATEADGLSAMRMVYLAAISTAMFVGGVTSVVAAWFLDQYRGVLRGVFGGFLLCAGVLVAWQTVRRAQRPLAGATEAEIGISYRRAFLRHLMMLSSYFVAALVNVAYVRGGLVSLSPLVLVSVTFALSAPTVKNLERQQNQLVLAGTWVSLPRAIRNHSVLSRRNPP